MTSKNGYTRASLRLREEPEYSSKKIEALGSSQPVNILSEQGDWLEVEPKDTQGSVSGFVPRFGIATEPEPIDIFPTTNLPDETQPTWPAVPRSLKAQDMLNWLTSPSEKPSWIADSLWDQLDVTQQQKILQDILSALQEHDWTAWIGEISTENRLAEALLDEWLVILEGGRNVWHVRDQYIYEYPNSDDNHISVNTEQIMLWTGHVKKYPSEETKNQLWYQVNHYRRWEGEIRGHWGRKFWLDEYIFPTPETDPRDPSNKDTIFDLSKRHLRYPSDQEITDALAEGQKAQYINIQRVIPETNKAYNFNLCGEFCVAALVGEDVIPFLDKWKESEPIKAENILKNDLTTGIGDLKSMLSLYGRTGDDFIYSSSVTPTSARFFKDRLLTGKKAIVGVMIKKSGKLSDEGKIKHWVVLEDAVSVANDGWVRLYNPFFIEPRVYIYKDFIKSFIKDGSMGLWVDHDDIDT